MAHEIENENVFTVGTPAWHRLGVVLENPPTVEEGIVAAGLNWEVSKEPIYTGNQVKLESHVAITRSSDQKVLGVLGADYTPVQNLEAFQWFQPWLDSGDVTLESAGSLFGGKRIWVLGKVKIDPSEVVPGDEVESYILLSNSHDGSMAVRAGFTPVRVVCHNTLSAAHRRGDSRLLRVVHRGNVKDTLTKIQEVMDLHRKDFVASAEQYKILASRQINEEDFRAYVRKVFDTENRDFETLKALIVDTTDKRQMENKLLPLFEDGIGSDLPGVRGTLWGAYNAVTEFLTHHRGRNLDNRFNALWFGESVKINQRALAEAVALAA